MERDSRFPMAKTEGVKILRRSIYVFLQNYQPFTTTAAILALPLAASALISHAFFPSLPLLRGIYSRLQSLFDAAGFPRSSDFFAFLNLKLTETIATSFLIIPFTLAFLLLAKAFVIKMLSHKQRTSAKPPHRPFLSIYNSLLITQLCNILVIFSANATCFCLLFFAYSWIDGLGLSGSTTLLIFSSIGGVIYSIILANALVICSLALTLSGMENRGGYLSILKACVLIRGRTSTSLSLALPVNTLLAAVEALFQYRIVRAYQNAEIPLSSMAFEGLLIVYIYSVLLVLDIVIGCTFYTSCKSATRFDREGRSSFLNEIDERDEESYGSLKTLQDFP